MKGSRASPQPAPILWVRRRRGAHAFSTATGFELVTAERRDEMTGADAALIRSVFRAIAPGCRRDKLRVPRRNVDAVAAALEFLVDFGAAEVIAQPTLRLLTLPAANRRALAVALAGDGIRVVGSARVPAGALCVVGPFSSTSLAGFRAAAAAKGGISIVDVDGVLVAAENPTKKRAGCIACATTRLIARYPREAGHAAAARVARSATLESPTLLTRVLAELLARACDQFALRQHASNTAPLDGTDASLARTALVYDEVTTTFSAQLYLPSSDCPFCGQDIAPSAAAIDEDGARAVMFDPHFGPLFSAELATNCDERFRGLPLIWGGVALIARGASRSTGHHGTVGTGASLQLRRRVVMYEGVERYALRARRPDLVNKTLAEVSPAVSPETLPLYDATRYALPAFPFRPFQESTRLNWCKATHLVDGREAHVPWEAVAVDFAPGEYPERVFETLASSGAAAHRSRAAAVLGAGREVIERDAFMVAWLRELVPPRVNVPPVTGDVILDELLSFLRARMELTLFDLRLDFPLPTFCAIARARDARGCLVPGSRIVTVSGGATAAEALRRALMEMVLFWEVYALSPSAANAWQDVVPPTDARAAFYDVHGSSLWTLDPQHAPRFRAFDAAKRVVEFNAIEPWLGATDVGVLAQAFSDRGLDPWVVDITPHDLTFLGAVAIRLIVPGLVPLEASQMSRRVPRARVDAVAARAGTGLTPDGALNPAPHPLI